MDLASDSVREANRVEVDHERLATLRTLSVKGMILFQQGMAIIFIRTVR